MEENKILSSPELRRYAPQISLPQMSLEGQEKLKKGRVAVVGIGGLGSFVLQYLAAIGVGYIGIIDFNLIDETHIQRQALYGGNDLGKLKSIAGKERIQELFPFNTYEIINLHLTERNVIRVLQKFELVVDATNNFYSNRVILDAASALGIPVVHGFVQDYKGSVAVIFKKADSFLDYLKSKINTVTEETKSASALAYGMVSTLLANEVQKILTGVAGGTSKNLIIEADLLNCTIIRKEIGD